MLSSVSYCSIFKKFYNDDPPLEAALLAIERGVICKNIDLRRTQSCPALNAPMPLKFRRISKHFSDIATGTYMRGFMMALRHR